MPFFLFCCKSEQHHKGELQFYYYPGKNVYYDPSGNYFLYSLNGAMNWKRLNNLSESEPNILGEKIVIYTSDPEIYKENNSHRKLYNGILYAINTNDPSTFNGAEVIEQKKVISKKKATTVQTDEIKKPKSGIGKFLHKIFGKKKQE